MEDIFSKLQIKGFNNIENLVKWMAKAHIIDPTKRETEKELLNHFRDVPDAYDISLDKFKEIISAFAQEQNKTTEEMTSKLGRQIPTVLDHAGTFPGVYVATPGSDRLSIYSRLSFDSDNTTLTDYSLQLSQDRDSEVANSIGELTNSIGELADSIGEVPTGSQGDVVDCNVTNVLSGSQPEVSNSSQVQVSNVTLVQETPQCDNPNSS